MTPTKLAMAPGAPIILNTSNLITHTPTNSLVDISRQTSAVSSASNFVKPPPTKPRLFPTMSKINLLNNQEDSTIKPTKDQAANSSQANSIPLLVTNITKQGTDLKLKDEKDKLLKQLDLLSTIGTGTFGRVMVARDKLTKQYYALKIMSIYEIIRLKQIEHVKNEKSVLEAIENHPFIVKLYWTHHTDQYLYMLLEYVPGGELFSLLRQRVRFDTKMAVFYAAEIVCALEFLHNMQIVYRDLKPENIILDLEGHLKLTDFGFAKRVANKTYTLCGTPEYLAPEVK